MKNEINDLNGQMLMVNVTFGWQLRWRLRLMMLLMRLASLLMHWELMITETPARPHVLEKDDNTEYLIILRTEDRLSSNAKDHMVQQLAIPSLGKARVLILEGGIDIEFYQIIKRGDVKNGT